VNLSWLARFNPFARMRERVYKEGYDAGVADTRGAFLKRLEQIEFIASSSARLQRGPVFDTQAEPSEETQTPTGETR